MYSTSRTTIVACVVSVCCAMAQSAQAHFIWLAPQSADGAAEVHVYFAEDAAPDDPALLKHVEGVQAWQVRQGEPPQRLELQRKGDVLLAKLPEKNEGVLIAAHDFGVLNRGDAVFRLKYYAKAGPSAGHPDWAGVDCTKRLRLDIVPTIANREVRLDVRFEGQPIQGAQVIAGGPGLEDFEAETDASGTARFAIAGNGRYSIRARHIEAQPGELDGKKYPEVRHYCTVTLDVQPVSVPVAAGHLEPLEQPVTSFGGAIMDGSVYIYGGHTGSAHSYSKEEQDHFVRRLNLTTGRWEQVANGPPLQGLALVAHRGKLYRIGGFTARNAEGEEHELWSQDSVASFDPETGEWSDMPPLPESRSSFDAAVLGETVYVIGGWKLAGDAENVWHETAWAMDLAAERPAWKELPAPPFQRRALAVAAHDEKIYAIGGMQREGGPTTRVDVFDPRTGTWSLGPSLVTETAGPDSAAGDDDETMRRARMAGFGASAFATGGRLYVSTIDGSLQRLSTDGSQWKVISKTPTARFFHRMLPIDDSRFVVVGGANMSTGKFAEVEVISVN